MQLFNLVVSLLSSSCFFVSLPGVLEKKMLMLQLSGENSRIMQYFSEKADCEGKGDQFLDC